MAKQTFTPFQLLQNNIGIITAAPISILAGINMVGTGNQYPMTGKEILLFQNTDVAVQTVTIQSVPDNVGRSGDLVLSMAAGSFAALDMNTLQGFIQSDGNCYFYGSVAVTIKCIVLRHS